MNVNELIEKYKLSELEHREILELLKENIFFNREPSKKSIVMFVIGPPGSGKTTFINSTDLSEYVIINSDNYRSFNKYSEEILDKYPINYAKLTNYDAHLWGDELFTYAIQNRYSVLREKAPIDDNLLEVIREIPGHYEVIVNLVVAGNLTSLLRTRERYEREILNDKTAKLSSIESHNKCYELIPDLVLKLLSLGIKVNYISAIDHQYKAILVTDNALALLKKLRDESNERAINDYEKRMSNIKNSMNKRKALQDQFLELEKIESIYLNLKSK